MKDFLVRDTPPASALVGWLGSAKSVSMARGGMMMRCRVELVGSGNCRCLREDDARVRRLRQTRERDGDVRWR
jgi:hypothetical protein